MPAVLLAFGIILAATLDPASPLDADVNGAYLVIQSDSPRDWSGLNVSVNRQWAFNVPKQAASKILCVRLSALTAADRPRVMFDFREVAVARIDLSERGTPVPLRSATSGWRSPLSPSEASRCIG